MVTENLQSMASRSAPFLISTSIALFLGGIIIVAVMFHGHNQRPHVSKQNPTRVNLVHIDDYYNSSHQDYNSRVDARMQRDMARVATLTQLLNFSSERSGREFSFGTPDGSYSKGTLLREIITIAGVWYDNTAIGCGTMNHGGFGMVPGILGLGDGPLSYVNQQGDMYRGGFSYCLSLNVFSQTGWLEFGLGSMPSDPVWVPLQEKPIPDLPLYYVGLIGLGVDNERLPIPESAFRFPREIYEVLKGAYLEKTATIPRASSFEIMDTCYDLSIDFQAHMVVLPLVSLYFPTGVLRLGSGTLLEVHDERKTYCLAFAPHDFKFSIIGNVQQQGIQVSYDLHNRRVAFGPKNC
ncbi:hypothetical protein ACFE04_029369 [Oxalis oulophora]